MNLDDDGKDGCFILIAMALLFLMIFGLKGFLAFITLLVVFAWYLRR